MGKLEIYGIVVAVALIAAFGWGQHRHSQGVDEERGRWEVKAAAATKADLESLTDAVTNANRIAGETFKAVSNIKVVNKTITNEVQREIKTDVRYAADCLPDSGLQLWNVSNRGVLPTSTSGTKPAGSRTVVSPAR